MTLTNTVSSLAHDAASAASDIGSQAAGLGRSAADIGLDAASTVATAAQQLAHTLQQKVSAVNVPVVKPKRSPSKLLLVLVAAVLAGGFVFWSKRRSSSPSVDSTPTKPTSPHDGSGDAPATAMAS